MKTDLFEYADVTASIYHPSEQALGSLGITQGHFVICFGLRIPHNIRVDGDIFENAPHVDADFFIKCWPNALNFSLDSARLTNFQTGEGKRYTQVFVFQFSITIFAIFLKVGGGQLPPHTLPWPCH